MRVVLGQLTPVPADPEANADRAVEVLRAHPGADLAVFPELFLSGYALDAIDALAGPVDGPALSRVAAAAGEAGTAVVIGFAERTAGGGVANSVACLDSDGRPRAVYRKTHLFGPGEEAAFVAGERLVVADLAGHAVAPLICFDMEFPEPARALARAGAELLVTASANMEPYAYEHELASRARAMDNRRPHVYVNRTGREHGFEFLGASRAVDADGQIIVEAGAGEEVLEAEVALGAGPRDAAVDYLALLRDGLEVERAG